LETQECVVSSPRLELPADLSLPYFAYGALKREEIAWPQISGLVKDVYPATAPSLKIAVIDGTAYAVPHLMGVIQGDLIHFSNPQVAYAKISLFEGMHRRGPSYEWVVIQINGQAANILKSPQPRQIAELVRSWSVADDPVFSHGLRWIRQELEPLIERLPEGYLGYTQKSDYWSDYFRLQSLIAFQYSFHERIETYRLGATNDERDSEGSNRGVRRGMKDRRIEMSKDPAFIKAIELAQIDRSLSIRGYRHPGSDGVSADRNPLESWYRVRSNIAHHGKGSEWELKKVLTVAVDHFNTLLEFVKIISPRLAEIYQDLTQLKLTR
jgi:hypothetical protein